VIYTADQLLIVDFVQAVLRRPAMYTEKGTYYEAVAFLRGYLMNMPGQHFNHAPWFDFLAWLKEQLGEGEGSALVRHRDRYENDAAAISSLKDLYAQFLPIHAERVAD
jgi:hypothetical protein